MGISGRYAEKFEEANLASAVGVHMNGDYHFFFDVVEIEGKTVKLKSHKDGSIWEKKIQRRKGQEYIMYDHSGIFQRITGRKPERVKVMPFSGERF